MTYDLRPFIQWILDAYEPSVRVGIQAGSYTQKPGGTTVQMYGSADMACIFYALGLLDGLTARQRAEWVEILQAFQEPNTGFLIANTAFLTKPHNTAFTIAALNLFEALPALPLQPFGSNFDTPEKMKGYINTKDWHSYVYPGAEDIVGIASAFALVPGTVGPDWFDWFIDYVDTLFDPNNGMVGQDKPPQGDLDQIGGTFHMVFFWEYFKRRTPYLERQIDAILGLQLPEGDWTPNNPWWMTQDAIYMLMIAARHTDYRIDDVRAAVDRAVAYVYQNAMDPSTRAQGFGQDQGVHTLNGTMALFASAQQLLGRDVVISPQPLRLVLDKRPYI